MVSRLVFESPVRSRSLASKALDRDRDRSSKLPNCQKPGPDLCGPVFFGLFRLQDRSRPVHHRSRLVSTGLIGSSMYYVCMYKVITLLSRFHPPLGSRGTC